MKDKDEIIRQMKIWQQEFDDLPTNHPKRSDVLDKINVLRWVLGLPPVNSGRGIFHNNGW